MSSVSAQDGPVDASTELGDTIPDVLDVEILLPNGETVLITQMSVNDPITSIKPVLFEYFESAYYSNYDFITSDSIVVNEYAELKNYCIPGSNIVTFIVASKDYDVKSARAHIKRVKEVLIAPPIVRGSPNPPEGTNNAQTDSNDKIRKLLDKAQELYVELEALQTANQEKAEPESASTNIKKKNKNSREDAILSEIESIRSEISKLRFDAEKVKKLFPALSASLNQPVELSNFYNELLFRLGTVDSSLTNPAALPAAIIKTVSLSGWNPPPPYRKVQGDLMYIEVVTESEGIFQITSTAKGFYLNRSNRQVFDPKPAEVSNFSHELFELLLMSSNMLRSSWERKNSAIRTLSAFDGNALDSLATLYAQGQGDSSVQPQWNYPPSSAFVVNLGRAHKHNNYDLGRVQDDLILSSGGDERGAPREWNEEIQALRSLPENDIAEKIQKAKYIYRVMFEFNEACKSVVQSICDKLITPVNYNDEESVHIYLHNGIFISRALDTDDRFKLLSGHNAHRKSALHDLNNQTQIMQCKIDGVSNVLCNIVDFKGDRFVCQTLIPGILSPGESNARLMYGALEQNKRLTVKNSSLELMEKIGSHFHIPKRQIPAKPFESESESDSAGAEVNSQSPVRVDTEDEVDSTSKYIPFVGCLEGKVLRGTDGKTYVLEMARLTCRDANFVKGPKGTGKISDENLSGLVEELAPVYVLRSELIKRFVDYKVKTQRDKVITEVWAKYKKSDNKEAKEGEEKAAEPTITPEEEESIGKEIRELCKDIKPENFSVSINPNVFFDCANDVDSSVVLADEAQAREIATHLWDVLIPSVTEQVRLGEFTPFDNESLVTTLHALGINMRYLGRLAQVAFDQEMKDLENISLGKQRIQSMPYFWLELLEIEIIARSVKHFLDASFRDSPSIYSCPGETIASLLSHILGSVEIPKQEALANPKGGKQSRAATSSSSAVTQSSKDKKKKGKKSSSSEAVNQGQVPDTPNVAANRVEALNSLNAIMKARFGCNSLLTKVNLKKDDKAPDNSTDDFLSARINKVSLLRRICKVAGLRVATKHYDFNAEVPISSDDIVAVVPRTKTSESSHVLPEATAQFYEARSFLEEGKYQEAFELAHEASSWIHQICGPIHKDSLEATDHLTNILCYVSDYNGAVHTSLKCLNIATQLYGLDSQEVLQTLMQLSAIFVEMRDYENAMKYILSAKYSLELLSGDRHPEMATIYCHLATIARDVVDYDYSFKCYNEARTRTTNLARHCRISEDAAEVLMLNDKIDEALQEQKIVYSFISNMVDEDSPTAKESKNKMEKYLRLVTIRNVNQMKEKMQDDAAKREKDIEAAKIRLANMESSRSGSKGKANFRRR